MRYSRRPFFVVFDVETHFGKPPETSQLVTLIQKYGWVSLIAAATIYIIGHARIRDEVTDEQAIAAARGTAEKA